MKREIGEPAKQSGKRKEELMPDLEVTQHEVIEENYRGLFPSKKGD